MTRRNAWSLRYSCVPLLSNAIWNDVFQQTSFHHHHHGTPFLQVASWVISEANGATSCLRAPAQKLRGEPASRARFLKQIIAFLFGQMPSKISYFLINTWTQIHLYEIVFRPSHGTSDYCPSSSLCIDFILPIHNTTTQGTIVISIVMADSLPHSDIVPHVSWAQGLAPAKSGPEGAMHYVISWRQQN